MNDQQRAEVDQAVRRVLADTHSSKFSIHGTIVPDDTKVRGQCVEFVGKVLDRMERTESPVDREVARQKATAAFIRKWAESHEVARSTAWADVAAERQRQIEVEGFTPERDVHHEPGALAQAAAVYLMPEDKRIMMGGQPVQWPFEEGAYKPSPDRRRDLVRGIALGLAELERYDATEGRT